MSNLGSLYRNARAFIEPKLYAQIRNIPDSETLRGKHVLVLGDGLLASDINKVLSEAGCAVAQHGLMWVPDERYDAGIICEKLEKPVADSEGLYRLNHSSMASLRALYFANQNACKCVCEHSGSIINILSSDSGDFWNQEILGLIKGIAMAMSPQHVPVNAIHFIRSEGFSAEQYRDYVYAIRSLLMLWLSGAGHMSSGNIFKVCCTGASE